MSDDTGEVRNDGCDTTVQVLMGIFLCAKNSLFGVVILRSALSQY